MPTRPGLVSSSHSLSGPAQAVLAFGILIILGTIALLMPAAAPKRLHWVDALFTATSSVCITGLSTIDVGSDLHRPGQAIVLILIQLGGIGITTLSTLFLASAGRATLHQSFDVGESLAAVRVQPMRVLWWAICVTFVAEFVGMVVLATRFDGDDAWWHAMFHSVSAFCNAGFTLLPDNAAQFREDPVILSTLIALIALGGIGFIVLRQSTLWLLAVLRGRRFPLFLHTRVVLVANLVLWTLGAILIYALERRNSFQSLTGGESVANAIFLSFSVRTAGFSTIDPAHFRELSLFTLMFFMLIGASPGGCGGGIKVTTAAVILATVFARLRNMDEVRLFRRSVRPATVQRAFLLLSYVLLFLTLIVTGLLISEEFQPTDHPGDRLTRLSFEAVSAFGTVGLTAGATPQLSFAGKLIIIVTMFVGRLGPLVVALAIVRPRSTPRYSYPHEELAIG